MTMLEFAPNSTVVRFPVLEMRHVPDPTGGSQIVVFQLELLWRMSLALAVHCHAAHSVAVALHTQSHDVVADLQLRVTVVGNDARRLRHAAR